MTRSMTGYGRALVPSPQGNLLVEVHTVNRKALEIQVYAPKEFLLFDIDLRRAVADVVKRGQVSVRLSRECGDALLGDVSIDSLRAIHTFWQGVADTLGIEGKVDLPFLAEQASKLPRQDFDEAAMREAILAGVQKALLPMIAMKEEEGRALVADLLPRLDNLEEEVERLTAQAEQATIDFRAHLERRLGEIEVSDDDRLTRETVIFAEKSDVTEELIRLRSHIEQARTLLGKEESVGRPLDFLLQEMIRETNTIASKTHALGMTGGALRLKSEIEKIREQGQNIE